MTSKRALVSVAVLAFLGPASVASAAIATYPSSTTILPTGPLPPAGGTAVSLNTAIGEVEDGIIVVTNAHSLTAVVDKGNLGNITVQLLFGHFVSFGGGRTLPDALPPWDGIAKNAEKPNQPIWVQVTVPYGTTPGSYKGTISVTADGKATNVPLLVRVFPVTIPPPTTSKGNLPTAFVMSAETYLNTAAKLYGLKPPADYLTANNALFAFLARNRIGTTLWGYGEPATPAGYTTDRRWWKDSATNMANQVSSAGGFPAMALPISNNRTSPGNYIAGVDPKRPDTWCPYLQAVHDYWQQHNFTNPNVIPYLYGQDEPGAAGFTLVGKQAEAAHKCFPGSKELVTGNPFAGNKYLWDGKGTNDVDIWTVLASRFYGQYTNPSQAKKHISHERDKYKPIQQARANGKLIWSYTYQGAGATPGFLASEPVSDARMFPLWAALENVQGLLYEGLTNFTGNPLDSVAQNGGRVLIYPGSVSGPITSARVEQIRDGAEDWAVLNIVRQKRGISKVWSILGGAGLFSASRAGVKLACSIGCDLKGPTPFSWPLWSHDATTPQKIEAAKLAALQAAG